MGELFDDVIWGQVGDELSDVTDLFSNPSFNAFVDAVTPEPMTMAIDDVVTFWNDPSWTNGLNAVSSVSGSGFNPMNTLNSMFTGMSNPIPGGFNPFNPFGSPPSTVGGSTGTGGSTVGSGSAGGFFEEKQRACAEEKAALDGMIEMINQKTTELDVLRDNYRSRAVRFQDECGNMPMPAPSDTDGDTTAATANPCPEGQSCQPNPTTGCGSCCSTCMERGGSCGCGGGAPPPEPSCASESSPSTMGDWINQMNDLVDSTSCSGGGGSSGSSSGGSGSSSSSSGSYSSSSYAPSGECSEAGATLSACSGRTKRKHPGSSACSSASQTLRRCRSKRRK